MKRRAQVGRTAVVLVRTLTVRLALTRCAEGIHYEHGRPAVERR